MIKKIFFSSFLLANLGLIGQNLKVNGTQMCELNVRHTEMDDFSPKVRSTSKVSASATQIGQTPNGFGCGFGPLKPVYADENLNAIAVIHRSDFTTNGDNGTGSFRYDLSVDGGTSWNNNIGPIYNPNPTNGVYPGPGRYPSCVLINPNNSTTASGAYMAFWGPTRDHSNGITWGGQLMATEKLDNTDRKIRVDSSTANGPKFLVSRSFWKASETTTFGIQQHFDELTQAGYLDSLILSKGVWNSTTDSLEYNHSLLNFPVGSDGNGAKVIADNRIAFGLNGQTGFVVVIGYSSSYPTYGVYHPMVMKTTNGGTTWSSPTNISLDNLMETTNNQSLLSIYQDVDSTWSISNLSTAFDCDITVDKNGNPHILVNICPAAITTIPPGGTAGTEFSIFSGINGMVDIYSTDGGTTWKSAMVGFPQTFRGGFGADPSAPDVTEDNRPHCSRSADGSKIFFHWFDTDAQLWGTSDNIFPDWWVSGYDTDVNSFNYPPTNMTDDLNTQGTASFGNVAPQSWTGSSMSSYKHHCVIQQLDQTTNDFYDPAQYIYMTDESMPIGLYEYPEISSHELYQNFPNPVDDYTRIRFKVNQSSDYELKIINSVGQLVLLKDLGRLTPGEEVLQIYLSDLSSGMYIYSVRSNEGVLSKSMIVN